MGETEAQRQSKDLGRSCLSSLFVTAVGSPEQVLGKRFALQGSSIGVLTPLECTLMSYCLVQHSQCLSLLRGSCHLNLSEIEGLPKLEKPLVTQDELLYWSLNSGPYACSAGALTLELRHQPNHTFFRSSPQPW
jgi:hypothetical protein